VPPRVALAARTTFLCLVAIALAAGCGDDEEEGGDGQAAKPKTVRITMSGSGKNLRYSVPKSVPGGVARLELTNQAEGEHDAQLGYVDEGHTAQEGLDAATRWAQMGRPLPAWVHLAGGVLATPEGATNSVTQRLPRGKYFVLDTTGEEETSAFFEVTAGDGAAELPSAPATISATEYEFDSTALKAGKIRVLFENVGAEPHFVEGLRLKPGKTIDDVRRFVRTEKGEEPFVEDGSFSTTTLDGRQEQVVEIEPQSGSYALLCFVPDRKGGPPHVQKGMVSPATVD
jgi:hypothetical protein